MITRTSRSTNRGTSRHESIQVGYDWYNERYKLMRDSYWWITGYVCGWCNWCKLKSGLKIVLELNRVCVRDQGSACRFSMKKIALFYGYISLFCKYQIRIDPLFCEYIRCFSAQRTGKQWYWNTLHILSQFRISEISYTFSAIRDPFGKCQYTNQIRFL